MCSPPFQPTHATHACMQVRLTGLAPLVADMGLQQGAYVRLAWGPPTLRAVAGPGPGPAVLDQRVVVIEQVAGVA